MRRVLVVDDDAETCRFMQELLAAPDRTIDATQSPELALERVQTTRYDLVISDINLESSLTGIDLLAALRKAHPGIEVVLISGFGTLETAVRAVREGAFDYISKPFDIVEIKRTVERALKKLDLGRTEETPRSLGVSAEGLVGSSRGMLAVYKQIAQAAQSEACVLITGETGTGKELVARAIHTHSPRAAQPFVAVNCGAIAEGLLESELFGHVRGAFTGAVADKKGVFEQAHRGSIFLDEIGEMSPALQVRVLRTLQQGEIRPVGGNESVSVDVRIIAATHRNLEKAVAEGTFRQDLFYRLNVLRIELPALRDRRDDIPNLAAHFLRRVGERSGRTLAFSKAAIERLQAMPWPGNVRELENVIERASVATRSGIVEIDEASALAPAPTSNDVALFDGLPSLDELERRYLKHVLDAVGGNRSKAADVLGIDRRTLYRMAERFGMDLGETEREKTS